MKESDLAYYILKANVQRHAKNYLGRELTEDELVTVGEKIKDAIEYDIDQIVQTILDDEVKK